MEEFRSFLIGSYKQNGLRYEYLEKLQTEQQKLHKLEELYVAFKSSDDLMGLLDLDSSESK